MEWGKTGMIRWKGGGMDGQMERVSRDGGRGDWVDIGDAGIEGRGRVVEQKMRLRWTDRGEYRMVRWRIEV